MYDHSARDFRIEICGFLRHGLVRESDLFYSFYWSRRHDDRQAFAFFRKLNGFLLAFYICYFIRRGIRKKKGVNTW